METDTIEVSALKHAELMKDEELTNADLPKEFVQKITALKMAIGKFNKNPNDKLKEEIKRRDLVLANEINDWIEENLPTEEEYREQERLKAEKEKEKEEKPPVVPVAKVEETPPAPPTPPVMSQAEIDAENKKAEDDKKAQAKSEADAKVQAMVDLIKEKVNTNSSKRITTAELAQIIGKTPSHPQKVGNIVLRRKFPLNEYVIE